VTAPGGAGPRRRLPVALYVAVLAAVVALGLRFAATGPLWLDEALSVNIARLPVGDLLRALRHDGSPPLYYLLLHGWVAAFGTSAAAARALSGVLALLTIPAAYAFARSVASKRVAEVTALLVATSPFAVRYGSEVRMYALAQLLCALAALCLVRYVRTRALPWAAGVAACTGLLLLTHYWAMYLVAAVFLLVLLRRDWRAAAAVAAGGVLFLPWVPSFLYQLAHTGTPWAPRPQLGALVEAVREWSGPPGTPGAFLFVLLLVLALLGLLGRTASGLRVELDLRGRPLGRRLAAVVFGTLALGIVAGLLLGSGYAARYTAVVVVPFLVLVAAGTEALGDERVRTGVVAAAAVLGVCAAFGAVRTPRTEAGVVAAALRPRLAPGDLVVYCPDQLGPAVSRLLPAGVPQEVFPTRGRPERVDWVDYQARNAAGDPDAYARDLVARVPRGTIWLVVAGGYRTYGDRCDVLTERLRVLRPDNDTPVRSRRRYVPERMALVQFRP
jgi:mannosyltransferase